MDATMVQIRETLAAHNYQMLMAQTALQLVNDLLSSGEPDDDTRAIELVNWCLQWLGNRFSNLNQASDMWKESLGYIYQDLAHDALTDGARTRQPRASGQPESMTQTTDKTV